MLTTRPMTPPDTGRAHTLGLAAFLAGAVIVFWPAQSLTFLSDDYELLDAVRGQALAFWPTGGGGWLRPIPVLALQMDHALWGLDPRGYHITNILLHGLNAFMVVILAARLGAAIGVASRLRRRLALSTGIVFLLLPSHSEPVAWIAARADLIATFFALASLVFYLAFRTSRRTHLLILALLFFAAALLSKESTICLPALVLIIEAAAPRAPPGPARTRSVWGLPACFFGIVALYALLRYLALDTIVGGYGVDSHLTLNPERMVANLLAFSSRALFPPLPWKNLPVILFADLLILLVTVAWLRGRRENSAATAQVSTLRRGALLFSLLFLASLAPVLNLWVKRTTLEGERLLYLPSVFILLAVMSLVCLTARSRRAFVSVVLLIGLVSLGGLYRSLARWQAASRLAESVLDSLLAPQPPGGIVLALLPDSVGGAYVFRNGFAEALRLRGDDEQRTIDVVGTVTLYDGTEAVTVETRGNRFILSIEGRHVRFGAAPIDASVNQKRTHRLAELEPQRLQFELIPPANAESLLIYSGGELRPVGFFVQTSRQHDPRPLARLATEDLGDPALDQSMGVEWSLPNDSRWGWRWRDGRPNSPGGLSLR